MKDRKHDILTERQMEIEERKRQERSSELERKKKEKRESDRDR